VSRKPKAPAPALVKISAEVRSREWPHPHEAELVARLLDGEPAHAVLPSAGTSGMRCLEILARLVKEARDG